MITVAAALVIVFILAIFSRKLFEVALYSSIGFFLWWFIGIFTQDMKVQTLGFVVGLWIGIRIRRHDRAVEIGVTK